MLLYLVTLSGQQICFDLYTSCLQLLHELFNFVWLQKCTKKKWPLLILPNSFFHSHMMIMYDKYKYIPKDEKLLGLMVLKHHPNPMVLVIFSAS